MTLNELSRAAHSAAVAKGFYERERGFPELAMLVVTEIAEAVEADRNNEWTPCSPPCDGLEPDTFETLYKDTVEDEIADIFIRLFDLCGFYGIDIDGHVAAKMAYNATRPPKHGKAY